MFSFMAETFWPFYKNFQGFTYCSVFKVLCCSCLSQRQLNKFITTLSVCQEFFNFFRSFFQHSASWNFKRRRRDLNPRAATNDLLPFQGSPFSHLGTSAFMAESHSFKESDIQFAAPDPVLPDSAIQ